jgi:carbamoyl-phosphate synthase large subunit
MAKVAPSGVTGNTSFGRLLNLPEVEQLAEKALSILFKATGTGAHGFFTVDFKEDKNGVPFITEINVRHVAFTQCFAMGGANFAADTLKLLLNPNAGEWIFHAYRFDDGLVFLRDVDERPILMKESDLIKK